MRFLDEATIEVHGGHGGPGCVSFRRETFVPRGGPDGGDGGDGGDVEFIASTQLGTLQDFRYKREYRAESGHHGSGANKAGRDGESRLIRVPVGTVIRDAATGEILVDFQADGQTWLAAEGGRGGKGNAHFVSSTFQAPKFAQPGEEGQSKSLKLELKLFADVGLIGFPNTGKSTLISRMSRARPKIADYAFTTLTPNLGVVQLPDDRSFVAADIPGLIEGAHQGAGLGHRFLKHIERTALFVHVLDSSPLLEDMTRPDHSREENIKMAVEGMLKRYQTIRRELVLYDEGLGHKPEILVLNKLDLIESDPKLVALVRKTLRESLAQIRGRTPLGSLETGEPYLISAVTGAGIPPLLEVIYAEIAQQRSQKLASAPKKNPPVHQAGETRPATNTALMPDDQLLRK